MFQLLQQEFVQNAFLAGTIIAIVTSITGYFVILRSQAFAGHALSHIGFAGATGAALLGLSSLLGMYAFTLLAAIGMGALGERIRGRDVEIGMVLSFALGLGVLFITLYTQHAVETASILFGSIFSVTRGDILISLISGLLALLALTLLFRPLLFASIDPEVAQARGVPVRFLSIIFLLLVAITVSQAVQIVGVLLVFALLVAPAATAQRLAHAPLAAVGLSVILGLAFTWSGLLLACVGRWPVSFYIAALSALTYLIVSGIKRLHTPQVYRPEPCPQCENFCAPQHRPLV
jgi:zinc/manganese transport system permease protein